MFSIAKFFVPVVLAASALSSASATLTPFDAEYDGAVVYILDSFGTYKDFIKLQKDEKLSSYYEDTTKGLEALASAGKITFEDFVTAHDGLYGLGEKRLDGFAEAAGEVWDKSGSVNWLAYNEFAPASWSDVNFNLLRSAANTTKSDRRIFDKLTSAINKLEKEVELLIGDEGLSDVSNVINGKLTDFGKYVLLSPEFATGIETQYDMVQKQMDRYLEAAFD